MGVGGRKKNKQNIKNKEFPKLDANTKVFVLVFFVNKLNNGKFKVKKRYCRLTCKELCKVKKKKNILYYKTI